MNAWTALRATIASSFIIAWGSAVCALLSIHEKGSSVKHLMTTLGGDLETFFSWFLIFTLSDWDFNFIHKNVSSS